MLSRRLTVVIPTTGSSGGAGQGYRRARSDEAVLGVATANGGVVYSGGAMLVCGSRSTVSSPAAILTTGEAGVGPYGFLLAPIGGLGG